MVLFILSFLTSCDGESEIIMVAASLEKIISEKHSNFENNDKFHLNYGGSLSHARRIINNQNKIGAVIFSPLLVVIVHKCCSSQKIASVMRVFN